MNSLLPGFRPAPMRTANDCGPTALAQVVQFETRCTYDEAYRRVIAAWRPAAARRKFRDVFDTPGHHLLALRRLGMKAGFRRRLRHAQVARAVAAGAPVVLLLPRGLARWHWVVACGLEGNRIILSTGRGLSTATLPDPLHLTSRLLGIEGLGYGRLFPPNRLLESRILRLAPR